MGIVEGFTDAIVSDKGPIEKNQIIKILFITLLIRLLFIYFISVFLWPYVMPKLFKTVTANPTFLQILALSIMLNFLS
jgi:hypothetical protein